MNSAVPFVQTTAMNKTSMHFISLMTAACMAASVSGCTHAGGLPDQPQEVTILASSPALTVQKGKDGYRVDAKERIEELTPDWNLCRQLSLQMLQANQADGLFCPVSFYLTLPAAAASSSDSVQKELLSFLGETKDSDFSKFREIQDLVNLKDANVHCETATSTWINEKFPVTDFEKKVAEECQDTLVQGKWDPSLGLSWAEWINEHTNSMLEEAVKKDLAVFKDSNVKRLISNTLYFHSNWQVKFDPEETKEGTFHGKTEEKAEFMNMETQNLLVQNDMFTAVQLPLQEGYSLWAILPEEGTEIAELLNNSELSAFLDQPSDSETRSRNVILQIPRLTLKAQMTPEVIEEVMQANGVSFQDGDLQILQNAALNLNESGTEFAAYTEDVVYMGPGDENEPILLRFDRPFLIYICSLRNIPIGLGAVNSVAG